MLRKLLPREVGFFDLFDKHIAVTVEGTREFLALVNRERNPSMAARRIKEIEHEADTITHQCVDSLHKTFITPIDRQAIFKLIARLDDIMDHVEAAAERIALYEIETFTPELRELALVLVKATELLQLALKGLREFNDAPTALKACIDVNRLENEGDAIQRIAVARLFRETKDPIEVIKWKEVYETLENAIDKCEDAANVIEGVFLEHA